MRAGEVPEGMRLKQGNQVSGGTGWCGVCVCVCGHYSEEVREFLKLRNFN